LEVKEDTKIPSEGLDLRVIVVNREDETRQVSDREGHD